MITGESAIKRLINFDRFTHTEVFIAYLGRDTLSTERKRVEGGELAKIGFMGAVINLECDDIWMGWKDHQLTIQTALFQHMKSASVCKKSLSSSLSDFLNILSISHLIQKSKPRNKRFISYSDVYACKLEIDTK